MFIIIFIQKMETISTLRPRLKTKKVCCEGCENESLDQISHTGLGGCLEWEKENQMKKSIMSSKKAIQQLNGYYLQSGMEVNGNIIQRLNQLGNRLEQEMGNGSVELWETNHLTLFCSCGWTFDESCIYCTKASTELWEDLDRILFQEEGN
jgi:hypothetical protein